MVVVLRKVGNHPLTPGVVLIVGSVCGGGDWLLVHECRVGLLSGSSRSRGGVGRVEVGVLDTKRWLLLVRVWSVGVG